MASSEIWPDVTQGESGMADEEELEAIRRRKLQHIPQQMTMEGMEEKTREEELREAQKKLLLRRILTPDARERLGRVRMARPEYADAVEEQLLMLSKRMARDERIDDDTFKNILQRIMPKKREIRIERR